MTNFQVYLLRERQPISEDCFLASLQRAEGQGSPCPMSPVRNIQLRGREGKVAMWFRVYFRTSQARRPFCMHYS